MSNERQKIKHIMKSQKNQELEYQKLKTYVERKYGI
jgi:hypothetical protein